VWRKKKGRDDDQICYKEVLYTAKQTTWLRERREREREEGIFEKAVAKSREKKTKHPHPKGRHQLTFPCRNKMRNREKAGYVSSKNGRVYDEIFWRKGGGGGQYHEMARREKGKKKE